MSRTHAALLGCALLLTACARRLESPGLETTAVTEETHDAAGEAFGALFEIYDRVLSISERLRVANTEACGDHVGGYLGWMVFADRDFGSQEIRALAAKAVRVGETPVVVALSPTGPAASAGLRVGDEVVSIGGTSTQSHMRAVRAEWRLGSDRSTVVVRREGQELAVEVVARSACRYRAIPVDLEGMYSGPTKNGDAVVTIALVESATDDELAFSIAHAFALQRLGVDPSRNEPLPEPAATNLAVAMCERAGFDVSGVERLLTLQAIEQPWQIFRVENRYVAFRWVPRGPASVGELPRRIVALRAALASRDAK